MDNTVVHGDSQQMKTGWPQNRMVMGEEGLGMGIGEGEMRDGTEEGLSGPDSTTVTKWSDPKPVPESGHW